ncbi:hypothetical protein JQ559_18360 [Bradyrhizobium viridifuturi]|jgi:hypothetical protein|uniref:hypothetical protein n=1 Tax=Bradyrhizobium TaxID=374 RepID=UPI00130495C7|nr:MULTISPECIES: hypothetical protein [Bradyrhizobium]QRI71886.1 hypothetical protein JQ507_10615 [Bradyrhizobium sp. PSBB068]MBR1023228.1 hypothetical protein [Bradyrhizobium viridifuturi]MBR1038730.1 hypothetical protein [Bradyrhizobium viridifuturi]MBR1045618.1 hypothetical protein [Bradyrhizobium viridifuturi]MBR1071602.1 hypothetical protein [Bradyrhizobium viridifuturi]
MAPISGAIFLRAELVFAQLLSLLRHMRTLPLRQLEPWHIEYQDDRAAPQAE